MELTFTKIFSEEMIPPRLVVIALAVGFVLAMIARARRTSPVRFGLDGEDVNKDRRSS